MSKKIIQTSARLGDKLKAFVRVKSKQVSSIGMCLSRNGSELTAGSSGPFKEGSLGTRTPYLR